MITINLPNKDTLIVQPDDSSYRYRAIMGDDSLTLKFALNIAIEVPLGSYVEYDGVKYILSTPATWKRISKDYIEYTLVLYGPQEALKKYRLRNPQDGRLKFSMCATPAEFIKMLTQSINLRSLGWQYQCTIEAENKTIEFNQNSIYDALALVAETFETEFEVLGSKVIKLGKVEYYKDEPLPLSYGKGNGFMPETGRSNTTDETPISTLYVVGGTQNIDRSKYGSDTLHLPKNKDLNYNGKVFRSSPDGLSVSIVGTTSSIENEDSIELSDIYPRRIGEVTEVIAVSVDKYFYDIVDNTIPDSLNYKDYLIAGEDLTIIFQSGMLAGREFKINDYIHEKGGKAVRRFEITPEEIDGQAMPSETYIPVIGDKYIIFGCSMPPAYIADDANQKGAEWELFQESAKYLDERTEFKFTFTGELQGKYVRDHYESIAHRIVLGNYIRFSDTDFAPDGVDVRITGIKQYLYSPLSPIIEISNSVSTGAISSALKEIPQQEVVIEDNYKKSIGFTKRRWRDALETSSALIDAKLSDFGSAINPIVVQTMQMLVGDKSLQFRFVTNKTAPVVAEHRVTYDETTGQLTIDAGIIQHMTLGIDTITTEHKVSEYKFWALPSLTTSSLKGELSDKKYYLYAKCDKASENGVFVLSMTAIGMEAVEGYYHLLVGIVNSEYDGTRSFAPLYGFTEILPSQITTKRIASPSGELDIDLETGTITGEMHFKPGSSGLGNIDEFNQAVEKINGSVLSVIVEYALGDSETEAPTGTNIWHQTAPAWESGKYMWQRTTTTYVGGGSNTSQPTCISGAKGDPADNIISIQELYILTNSAVIPAKPTSEVTEEGDIVNTWTKTCPTFRSGHRYFICSQMKLESGKLVWSDVVANNDGKSRIFYTEEGQHPEPPYNVGDIWACANGTFTTSSEIVGSGSGFIITDDGTASSDEVQVEVLNEALICINQKPNNSSSDFDIADWTPIGAWAKTSDFEYLKKALNPDSSLDVYGGLLLANIIGIKDAESNVKAILNALTNIATLKDDEHGIINYASGISGAISQGAAKSAKTRIYEDGTIYTEMLKAVGGEFSGVFKLPFTYLDHTTLLPTDPSSILLGGPYNRGQELLELPNNDAFNGWRLIVVCQPKYTKSELSSFIKGKIRIPEKDYTSNGSYVPYYASELNPNDKYAYFEFIYFPKSGASKAHVGGWVLVDYIGVNITMTQATE